MQTGSISIQELAQKKSELEAELTKLITEKVAEFEAQTGVTCSRVYVDSISVTTYTSPNKKYIHQVETSIDLPFVEK